jgi:ABC-type antimicrobial peptide transport system permease subunit
MDWRIIYNTTVEEIQGHKIVPPYNDYQQVGDHRKCSALVEGINLTTIFNKFPEISSMPFQEDQAVIGDSVAGLIIDDSQYESIWMNDHGFGISGTVFDPMENGFTIYIDINRMRSILNQSEEYYNCAFITLRKMTDAERNDFILNLSTYMKQVYGPNFTALSLKDTFGPVIDSINPFIWLHFLLAILIFIFAIFYQLEFVKITIRNNSKDYSIMHATGINKRSIEKMIQQEFVLVLILASILAFSLGLIIDGLFLIKQPTLPPLFVPLAVFSGIAIILALINRVLIKYTLKF